MIPNSNPLAMLVQAAQRGGDPKAMMRQMAMQDPKIAHALKLIDGKSPQQLQATAINMAKERGIDLNQLVQSLGLMR